MSTETLRAAVKRKGYRAAINCESGLAFAFSAIVCYTLVALDIRVIDEISSILQIYVVACMALMGFIIAAYALILMVGDQKFRDAFFKHRFFKNIQVAFCVIMLLIGVCVPVSVVGILSVSSISFIYAISIFFTATFLFTWVMLAAIVVMTNSLRHLGDLLAI